MMVDTLPTVYGDSGAVEAQPVVLFNVDGTPASLDGGGGGSSAPTTNTVSETNTGAASTSNTILAANPLRKYLRLSHTDPANPSVSPTFRQGGAASANSTPLGGYGSYWEFSVPAADLRMFCGTASLKITVEEGF